MGAAPRGLCRTPGGATLFVRATGPPDRPAQGWRTPRMSFEHLIIHYGYPILFLGAMLEGEMFVLVAAYLAYRGYLSFPAVVVVALVGTFIGDMFFFWLGRTRGAAWLERRPGWQASAERVRGIGNHHAVLLAIGFRFLYGLRSVTPFVIGMSGFPVRRFVVLNSLGGLFWVLIITGLGFTFGRAFERSVEDLRRHEMRLVLVMAALGAVIWVHQLRLSRARARNNRRREAAERA